MRLNEKCDVYSFGVLSFEVVMGSHPGELISCLTSHTSNVDNTLFMDILDKRLLPPTTEIFKDVVLISKIAAACLNVLPESRPTMEYVTRTLSRCIS